MSLVHLVPVVSALMSAATPSTYNFSLLNCTSTDVNVNMIYTPLVGEHVLDVQTVTLPTMSNFLATTSAVRHAEEMLVNFVPNAGLPTANKVPLFSLAGSNVDTRLVYVGLLVDEKGALTWKRLRNHEMGNIQPDTSSTAGICATLFYYGFGM